MDVKAHEFSNLAFLGYESTLLIENIETLYLCILFYSLGLLLVYALKFMKNFRIYKWLVRTLLWNLILRFFIESYLELAMSCFINFRNVSEVHQLDDNINYWFAFVMLAILVCFPVFVLWFVWDTHESHLLRNRPLRSVFGSIYENLKLQRKRGVAFYAVFTIRRLLFALSLVYLDH